MKGNSKWLDANAIHLVFSCPHLPPSHSLPVPSPHTSEACYQRLAKSSKAQKSMPIREPTRPKDLSARLELNLSIGSTQCAREIKGCHGRHLNTPPHTHTHTDECALRSGRGAEVFWGKTLLLLLVSSAHCKTDLEGGWVRL